MKFGKGLEGFTEEDIKIEDLTATSPLTKYNSKNKEESESDEDSENGSLTVLPFFDIVYENIL